MRMISVSSSNLSSVGYEDRKLYITFKNGSTYVYHGVPESVYKGLMNALSHGSYHAQYIKNSFLYNRV